MLLSSPATQAEGHRQQQQNRSSSPGSNIHTHFPAPRNHHNSTLTGSSSGGGGSGMSGSTYLISSSSSETTAALHYNSNHHHVHYHLSNNSSNNSSPSSSTSSSTRRFNYRQQLQQQQDDPAADSGAITVDEYKEILSAEVWIEIPKLREYARHGIPREVRGVRTFFLPVWCLLTNVLLWVLFTGVKAAALCDFDSTTTSLVFIFQPKENTPSLRTLVFFPSFHSHCSNSSSPKQEWMVVFWIETCMRHSTGPKKRRKSGSDDMFPCPSMFNSISDRRWIRKMWYSANRIWWQTSLFCFSFLFLFFLPPSFVASFVASSRKYHFLIPGTRYNTKHGNNYDKQVSMNVYWPILPRMPPQSTQDALSCCYFYSPLESHVWGCAESFTP